MGKKPESTEAAPTRRSKFYRCRVEATTVFRNEERSVRLGPGLLISDEDYRELVRLKFVKPDWFDAAEEEEV